MTGAAFNIWLHGLAALLFCGAFAIEARRASSIAPRGLLLLALGASGLWALSVAGIGDGETPVRVMLVLRNVAWVAVLFVLSRSNASGGRWRHGAYGAVAACTLLAGVVTIAGSTLPSIEAQQAAERAWLLLRLLSTITALLLLHRYVITRAEGQVGAASMLATAIGVMWTSDLVVLVVAYAAGDWAEWLTTIRGLATVLVAMASVIAVQRPAGRGLSVSRSATAQTIVLAGGAAYVVVAISMTALIGQVAGTHARVVQAAFVVGTGTALLTLLMTPWLRAWTKVMIAKHLFTHRYDYRTEWMRFTDTLGVSGNDVQPLPTRVIKAVADLTASPAGLLLHVDRECLVAGPAWRWDDAPPEAAPQALVDYLTRTARIVDLDSCRLGEAPSEEITALPDWLIAREDAWAVVPLLRAGVLIGAIVLARPPVTRALDWEDFDLLGAAGRQAASYLAEERAHAALADAQRFDEFNRRFAFIMHDLKNLVSQTALVARNAERHADNPAFRADMIATLQDSSQRMTALLGRLAQRQIGSGGGVQPTSLRRVAERVAAARAAQHPVTVSGADTFAIADPEALDTLLGHLVQNAIEASVDGTAVELRVEQVDAQAIVTVIDRGCGMTAAFVRDRLFRPFVSDKPGGFGLGAYEARQMAEQMGGSVTVASREGEGSAFRVALRAATVLEQAA
ncbi:PEP-CTERM system histidine kinase PrsK [Sphingomonas sp. RHCKR47]|uniref:XrtA/PEP-CTERM system histidine kinase PrsK n=1 Tax=Sphingomonas citricola TaxID=2862498 RepID=UPI001CA4FAB3|nr:XrtA/PEP-CTERM system histidine kinase PrsK [Sphingomonas citricola]MBW6522547.1 PEP-CTERM system histidine kinase PrsK [Sphingomonas citricola]